MKYNIFLDDIRVPVDAFHITHNPIYNKLEWIVVRTHNDFVGFVTKYGAENISVISFDHDLADSHYVYGQPNYSEYKEKTGYHSAMWFCDVFANEVSQNLKDFPQTFSHSQNTIGKENITTYIDNFKRHILR